MNASRLGSARLSPSSISGIRLRAARLRKHAKTAKERGHKPKTSRQSHNGMRLCRVSLFARDCFQPFFTDARKDKKYLRKCFGKIRIAGEDFVLRIRLKDRTERMGGYYETCETVLVVFCHGCRRFAVCRTDCARRRIPVNFSVTGAMLLSSFLERPSADGLFSITGKTSPIPRSAVCSSVCHVVNPRQSFPMPKRVCPLGQNHGRRMSWTMTQRLIFYTL